MPTKRKTEPKGKKGAKRPAKKPTPETLKAPKDDNALSRLEISTVGKKFVTKVQIQNKLQSAKLTRTLSGASTLDLEILDEDGVLLNSGIFDVRDDRKLDALKVVLDGLEYRLVQLSANGDSLSLTFEDRAVAQLRRKVGPVSWTRDQQTRAAFVDNLVNKLSDPPKTLVPNRDVKREIEKVKADA